MGFKNFNAVSTLSFLNGWTASATGTNEYYCDGTSISEEPIAVFENDTPLNIGDAGNLDVGEFGFGDNDNLGYNTVYVRLSDETQPEVDEIKGSLSQLVLSVPESRSLGIVSIEIASEEELDANVKIIRTSVNDTELFSFIVKVVAHDYAILDHGITLESGQSLKMQSDIEGIKLIINANEVG